MATRAFSNNHPDRKAYSITGPTSGIGRATAFEVAKHGTVVLVGRKCARRVETGRCNATGL